MESPQYWDGFNETANWTKYTASGINVSVNAGAGPNGIDLAGSNDDVINGGTGTNTIVGGNGNVIVNLNGTADLVTLGGGNNTVNGFAGGGASVQSQITENSGNLVFNGSGNSDLILVGYGVSQIYAGTQTNLAQAITQAQSATPTNVQGDAISVQDGASTIVGGNGNDLIQVGAGPDVIVLGPGSDTFFGGDEVTNAGLPWSVTQGSNSAVTVNGFTETAESYSNPYPQPYYGEEAIWEGGPTVPAGPSSDTIFGGSGSDLLFMGNGNNDVVLGTGNSTVYGGMGNSTIIAGSGADLIELGGGSEYIMGGGGADTIYGGDGSNTIIGGSGRATIYSASFSGNAPWAGESSCPLSQRMFPKA